MLAAHAAAFVLGAVHALEVDHMVAVGAFVGSRPRLAAAVWFGVRWGAAHAAVVLAAGAALAVGGVAVPAHWGAATELAVGITLVLLGWWGVSTARRLHLHDPVQHGGHAHLHAHPPGAHPHSHRNVDPSRHHRHLSSLVGAVHGLAGTAPAVALVPVTLPGRVWPAMSFLAVFGLGTMLAMGLYAALAALALERAAVSVRLARAAARLTALASAGVGVWWIARVV